MDNRIKKALDIICTYGGIDGAHHKDWIIDQVTRALTGCPEVINRVSNSEGESYTFELLGENNEYSEFVRDYCNGEDGPRTYAWEVGIAP